MNIHEVAAGFQILVKKYRCSSAVLEEDQSPYQDEPPKIYIQGESRDVIATISHRNEQERGREPYSTSFLLSMNQMKPEFSPRRRKSLGERHANSFESFAHLWFSSTLWARKAGQGQAEPSKKTKEYAGDEEEEDKEEKVVANVFCFWLLAIYALEIVSPLEMKRRVGRATKLPRKNCG